VTHLKYEEPATRGDHVEARLRLVIERHDDFLGGSAWQHQVEGRSASEKGDAVADQLGEAFPVLGKCPRDLPWARGRRCL
jgi:hypothetical protein